MKKFSLLAIFLLMPCPAEGCIGGDMFDPSFTMGFWAIAGFALAGVVFTRIQRAVMKRQMVKSGASIPANFDQMIAGTNAIIFSGMIMVFLFTAGLMKINWGMILKI